MALTYIPIATVKVGSGGAASIDFTSIPGTYTDVQILLSGRSTSVNPQENLMIELNGSSANFTRRAVEGDGVTTPYSYFGSTGLIAYTNGDGATASTFGNVSIYIPNYAGSNYKSISTDAVEETNASTAYMQLTALLWSNSAAITSIKLKPGANDFKQYSSATLYGISKG